MPTLTYERINPDCSAMLYETYTGNMCSHYEPKDDGDSRELLEADVRDLMGRIYKVGYSDAKINHGITGVKLFNQRLYSLDEKRSEKEFIELIDRQAAITAHQWESYHNGMMREWMAKTVELQEQVDELTAERDSLQEKYDKAISALNKAAGKWAKADAELRGDAE